MAKLEEVAVLYTYGMVQGLITDAVAPIADRCAELEAERDAAREVVARLVEYVAEFRSGEYCGSTIRWVGGVTMQHEDPLGALAEFMARTAPGGGG